MGVQSGCVACPLDALAADVWEVAHIEAIIGSPYGLVYTLILILTTRQC